MGAPLKMFELCNQTNLAKTKHNIFKVRRIGFSTIVIMGIIGNPLLFYSMSKYPYAKQTFGFIMKCIVLCDTLNLVMSFGRCLELYQIVNWVKVTNWWPDAFIFCSSSCTLNWLLVALSFERILSACVQTRFRWKKRTWKCIIAVITFVCTMAFSHFPFYIYYNETVYMRFGTPMSIRKDAPKIARVWPFWYSGFCLVSPLFILIICFILLTITVKSTNTDSNQAAQTRVRERNMTLQLLYIISYEVIVAIPFSCGEIYKLFNKRYDCQFLVKYNYLVSFGLVLAFSRSATKFYIFTLPSKSFKKQFKQWLTKPRK